MKVIDKLPYDKWYLARELQIMATKVLDTKYDGTKSTFLGHVSTSSVSNNMRKITHDGIMEKRWRRNDKVYEYRRVKHGSDSDE